RALRRRARYRAVFTVARGCQQRVWAGVARGGRAATNAGGPATGAAGQVVMRAIGYGPNEPAQVVPLPQARNYGYHWFMATPRGAAAVRDDARGFTRYLWDTWSPAGWYTEEEFAEAAQAFDNPDWAAVVLHSYRHRWGFEPGDPAYAQDGARLTPAPRLAVPTLVLHGGADTCNQPASSEGKSHYFSGGYERRVLDGVGHFPQREAPQAVAAAILNFVANPPARG
ncbi:alpha/beta fold hydrolase, partial [Achromobacter ruhlandii]|uniref:alpha/beta fold hydrolase n=1 Tax=Achromobacter ruhlandii TaxID=72557 RepID=UPI0020166022